MARSIYGNCADGVKVGRVLSKDAATNICNVKSIKVISSLALFNTLTEEQKKTVPDHGELVKRFRKAAGDVEVFIEDWGNYYVIDGSKDFFRYYLITDELSDIVKCVMDNIKIDN